MSNSAEIIRSKDNGFLKHIRQLQQGGSKGQRARAESKQAVLDGIHLLQAWLGDPRLNCIVLTQDALLNAEIEQLKSAHVKQCPNTQLQFVEPSLWSTISELENSPPIMGLIELEDGFNHLPTIKTDTIILDAVQDAGNVGTILRTALACHFTQVICTVGTAHIWSPKVLRAAMGAHRHLHFYEGQTLEDIKNKVQIPLLATASSAQQSLYALEKMLQKPLVWVLGNEGQGVSQELLAFATQVRIPQNSQIESLNVAVSAAVCLYETQRVRGNLG